MLNDYHLEDYINEDDPYMVIAHQAAQLKRDTVWDTHCLSDMAKLALCKDNSCLRYLQDWET